MNIDELYQKLRNIDLEIYNLTRCTNSPEIILKRDELRKLEAKQSKENAPKIQILYEERSEVGEEIKILKQKNQRPTNDLPQKVNDFIRDMSRGVNWGGPDALKVRWVSPKQNYIILTVKGSTLSSGTNYVKTSHYLLDIVTRYGKAYGYPLFIDSKVKECEGRLTKEIKDQWIAYAEIEES